ncbi:hypothetical protein DPMN_138938 [Dreissena polymorpha]|uniref:Uncharacterized protein n=1 Tax=Dreissena polymorpha TaxID=45954 RepID=A0A9D4JHQ7_DREPO|nr:hypothetical protein DPMN_138938 [Dreissena polymorpha]
MCLIPDPAFSPNLNMAEYVRYGMSKALVCCASGFHAIQWHILNASEVWLPYPPETRGTDTPKTEEDGQVSVDINRVMHTLHLFHIKRLIVAPGQPSLNSCQEIHVNY